MKPTLHKEAKSLIKRLLKFEKKRIGRKGIEEHGYRKSLKLRLTENEAYRSVGLRKFRLTKIRANMKSQDYSVVWNKVVYIKSNFVPNDVNG